jgi:hypothetical protein
MQKDPEFLRLPFKEWAKLGARSTDPQALIALIDGAPIRLSGRCQDCGTKVSDQWCTADSTGADLHELDHLIEEGIGILRPSELAIIRKSLP